MPNFVRRFLGFVVSEAITLFGLGSVDVPKQLDGYHFLIAAIFAALYVGFEFGKWIGEGPTAPKRDTSIDAAIRYIVTGNFITKLPSDPDVAIVLQAQAAEAFRECAAEGTLRTWGRAGNDSAFNSIPKEYWNDHGLELVSLVVEDEPTDTETVSLVPGGLTYLGLKPTFREIMVNKREVEKCWRGGWRRAIAYRFKMSGAARK